MGKNYMRLKIYLLTITLLATFLFSQESEDTMTLADGPLVTIHAEDTHLPTILSMLAKQSNFNIVTGPNVQSQEKLTIHLDGVPISKSTHVLSFYYFSSNNIFFSIQY